MAARRTVAMSCKAHVGFNVICCGCCVPGRCRLAAAAMRMHRRSSQKLWHLMHALRSSRGLLTNLEAVQRESAGNALGWDAWHQVLKSD
mmetsp:Transcript_19662/g.26451  ORF Transcript_19662/g.26451 Transcript_19662/m.26451 type:complete len:89 (+) Transcript_19662:220-486(+)